MARVVLWEWMTLDGVFDADTMSQWFQPYDSPERGAYIKEVVAASGVLLLGKTTYEMFAAYWPHQKDDELASVLNRMPKYVVAPTLKEATWSNTTIISKNVVEEVRKLKENAEGDILVSGSAMLAHSLVKAGLVDEYRFLVQPVIMGSGKLFFGDQLGVARLELIEVKAFPKGVVLLRYRSAVRDQE